MQDFEKILGELNNGGFALDCNSRMTEVLKAVEDTGGSGVLTMRLKITRNDDGTAMILPEVSMKRPYKKRSASLFFIQNGSLHKEDPRQLTLPEGAKNVRSIEDRRLNAKEI